MAAIEAGATTVAALASDMSNAPRRAGQRRQRHRRRGRSASAGCPNRTTRPRGCLQAATDLERLAKRMAESVARFRVEA